MMWGDQHSSSTCLLPITISSSIFIPAMDGANLTPTGSWSNGMPNPVSGVGQEKVSDTRDLCSISSEGRCEEM